MRSNAWRSGTLPRRIARQRRSYRSPLCRQEVTQERYVELCISTESLHEADRQSLLRALAHRKLRAFGCCTRAVRGIETAAVQEGETRERDDTAAHGATRSAARQLQRRHPLRRHC